MSTDTNVGRIWKQTPSAVRTLVVEMSAAEYYIAWSSTHDLLRRNTSHLPARRLAQRSQNILNARRSLSGLLLLLLRIVMLQSWIRRGRRILRRRLGLVLRIRVSILCLRLLRLLRLLLLLLLLLNILWVSLWLRGLRGLRRRGRGSCLSLLTLSLLCLLEVRRHLEPLSPLLSLVGLGLRWRGSWGCSLLGVDSGVDVVIRWRLSRGCRGRLSVGGRLSGSRRSWSWS